jgi:hypothetical protein
MLEKKSTICIVHFRSIDNYPPVYNLLRLLDKNPILYNVHVITSKFSSENEFINIKFKQIDISNENKLFKYFQYLFFYLICFFQLVLIKPKSILYFESLSALPCILYKHLNKKTKLFVHYHEYMTPDEYRRSMFLDRINYFFEKLNRNLYVWFSHTNKERLQLFSSDFGGIPNDKLHVVPNFPLAEWASNSKYCKQILSNKIELVYIGAISFEDTYIKEVLDFVKSNEHRYNLELFSFSVSSEILKYIQSLDCNSIRYSGPIKYDNIPSVLIYKDVGLILYKANTLNFIYNAPNKLFEYLVLGLDVWFSEEMKGCYQYESNVSPMVFAVDFLNIPDSIINYNKDKNFNYFKKNIYTTQNATVHLINELVNS